MRAGWHIAAAAAAGCLPELPDPPADECAHPITEVSPCALSRAAPWPMFRRDVQHTGQSALLGPAMANLKWSFDTGGPVHATPSIGADGTIYVASHGRHLHAVAPDGSQRWALAIGEAHSSVAIRSDGILYVASEEVGNLFLWAVDPGGTTRWKYPVDDEVHASPAISANGTVYFCGHDGKVHAVGPDGTRRWTAQVGACHSSPALATDGTIYVGSEETHRLYALRADGVVSWEFETGGPVESSPAIGADGTIYFGSSDGKVYALDPGGAKKWEYETAGLVVSSPSVSGGRAGGEAGCAPGVVFVGSRDGKLYALSPGGTLLWSYPTGPIGYSAPTVDQNATVYVGSRDGKLYAIDCQGNRKWDFATEAPISSSSAAIGPAGTLYFGSDDGRLYALGD